MKSDSIRVNPETNDCCPHKKREVWRHTDIQKRTPVCDNEAEIGVGSIHLQAEAGNHQKQEKRQFFLSQDFQRRYGPADALILDF